MSTMDAVRTENGSVTIESIPIPTRKPGEALIKVIRAGICNTDLEEIKGYYGYKGVLGHEFLGVVEEVDADARVKEGQRVVGDINVVCNKCETCKIGGVRQRNHYSNRTVLGIVKKIGAMADYVTLPASNLHVVSDNISDENATFAEPLAAAFRIVEQGVVKDGDAVAVIGDGKLGLLIAHALNTVVTPGKLTIFGKYQQKLDLLPDSIIKQIFTDNTVAEFSNKFDVVVEASGRATTLVSAIALIRPLGTLVMKTTCAPGESVGNLSELVVKELIAVGSRCGNFDMALNALQNGLDLRKLITKVYPFSEALDAIKHAGTRGTLKIQLQME